MAMPKSLTTKDVARLCCVSDATVKRWEDAGLLKSERTNGGHRRFRVEEVTRFQREMELGVKQLNNYESVISTSSRKREQKYHSDSALFHSLIAGREEESANILINAYLNNKPLEHIFDQMIAPAMARIGELWVEGEVTVAQEHLATRTILSVLHRLRSLVPVNDSNDKIAMCCTIEGDMHEVSTYFVQMIFENQGFEVINFGANMPIYSLCEEITGHSAKIICISASIINDLERLSRDFADFNEKLCLSDVKIILGGRAFDNPHIRKRFPANFYADNFTELADFTKRNF